MAIKTFNDFNQVKEYAEATDLPRGGYALRIRSAEIKENSIGQYVEIFFDIAEGEYKSFFENNYQNQQKIPPKWLGTYFLSVPTGDGTEGDEWTKRKFKTFVTSLERSNPGYHFDWDEQKFAGLMIGGLFNMREYRKSDGTIGQIANCGRICSVDTVRRGNYVLPKDKVLTSAYVNPASAPVMGDRFVNVEEDVELPF